MTELLPCPFCGSPAETLSEGAITCANSSCPIVCGAPSQGYRSDYDPVASWNTRTPAPAQAPREPALHKAVRGLCIEIEGIWDAFEYGLRAEISNTNYVLIRDKIEEARTALTVSSTNRWPQDAIDQEMIERTSDDWVLPSPHGGTDA